MCTVQRHTVLNNKKIISELYTYLQCKFVYSSEKQNMFLQILINMCTAHMYTDVKCKICISELYTCLQCAIYMCHLILFLKRCYRWPTMYYIVPYASMIIPPPSKQPRPSLITSTNNPSARHRPSRTDITPCSSPHTGLKVAQCA